MAVTPETAARAATGATDSGAFLAVPQSTTQEPPPAVTGSERIDLSVVGDEYPGDDASKEQLAAWLAKQAEKRGLPPQLPVMAALVESGVRNLNYGDADSVGFFQMRVGIWNRGEYAGFPEKPELQAKWFLDTAEQVKKQRLAAGKSIDDPKQFGEWIADIERPAEQYRYKYQLRLQEADNLLRQAAGSSTPSPTTTPEQTGLESAADAASQAAPTGGAGAKALAALAEAKTHLGTPYVWGGATPDGFDCSGLVQYAFDRAGIDLPRVAEDQARAGVAVPRDDLRPGDLVYFADPSGYVYHIGISLGGDEFLHAPRTGDVVKTASLNDGYFRSVYAGARRVDGAAETISTGGRTDAGTSPPPAPPESEPAPEPKAQRSDSGVFLALEAQEKAYHDATAHFLKAVDPKLAALHASGMTAEEALAASETTPSGPTGAGHSLTGDTAPFDPDLAAVDPEYPGDDAPKAEIAKWMAKEAKERGIPPELPVMAALVESNLQNLDHGHSTSLGYFQMLEHYWNKGAYAGYPDNPRLQLKWFLDEAEKIKDRRVAAGKPIDDPRHYGEWIADVEKPAAQYRGRYQLRLAEARGLLK